MRRRGGLSVVKQRGHPSPA